MPDSYELPNELKETSLIVNNSIDDITGFIEMYGFGEDDESEYAEYRRLFKRMSMDIKYFITKLREHISENNIIDTNILQKSLHFLDDEYKQSFRVIKTKYPDIYDIIYSINNNEIYTLESLSKLTYKQIKQTYVYKNVPKEFNKSKLKKHEFLKLVKEHPILLEQLDPCFICYEQVTNKDHTLKCCNKIIHQKCLDNCLKHDDKCPHCRKVMKSSYRNEIDSIYTRITTMINIYIDDPVIINILIRGIHSNMRIKDTDANSLVEQLLTYHYFHNKITDEERDHRIALWEEESGR